MNSENVIVILNFYYGDWCLTRVKDVVSCLLPDEKVKSYQINIYDDITLKIRHFIINIFGYCGYSNEYFSKTKPFL